MGDMKSSYMIIGVLVYYFAFFLVLLTIQGGKRQLGYEELNLHYSSDYFNKGNPYNQPEICGGVGKSMNFLNNIPCRDLIIHDLDIDGCNNISGCQWQNYSSLFGIAISPAGCGGGLINESFYNISRNTRHYCSESESLITNRSLCLVFGCQWLNNTDIGEESLLADDNIKPATIWNNIKYVVTLQVDLGLGDWNFIVLFLFTFLPLIGLMIGVLHLFPFI